MRDGHGDIVPEGFYDPPKHDDLELIQSEYEKLYTLTQEMAEALDSLRCYAKWQIMEGSDFHPTLPSAILKSEQALTKWTEFKK